MSTLIKNGALITASDTFEADILIEGETISQIGKNLQHPSAQVVDASGKFITPGGVDPHTHFDLPMFGTVSSDDHYTGHKAAAFGGTTTVMDFVVQEPQLGTGHAVQTAAPHLTPGGLCLVLAGDVPLLRPRTLTGLVEGTLASGVAATVLTCLVPDAGAYGRIVKDAEGKVMRIVEAKDATEQELRIGEYNTGVFCFRTDLLRVALGGLTPHNRQGEYYLTDTVAQLVGRRLPVAAVATDDPGEAVGINTAQELAAAESLLCGRED